MDVIFRLRGRTSEPIWRYFSSAMVRQKVKLREHYFQLMYYRNSHTYRRCGLISLVCEATGTLISQKLAVLM